MNVVFTLSPFSVCKLCLSCFAVHVCVWLCHDAMSLSSLFIYHLPAPCADAWIYTVVSLCMTGHGPHKIVY
ncbi:hypothetical protein BD309DRAFT_27946 [Dichomitus squalens]|uniref:Uncharacterized protein n=1 Tax=Dichomitus squalens TaxID=114155 RepID=A0A4Q9NWF1_9APHY|nr:hypothetical protein BD309DRAFT_27946 [Dichomitus squalens]TBU54335.1 hypothetical protein BD310DRAFT_936115 [Dichomitus squalens]